MTNIMRLSGIPLRSRIEHFEQVRTLPLGKRFIYTISFYALMIAAFVICAGLAVLANTAIYLLVVGELRMPDDLLLLLLPIVSTLMVCIGFVGKPLPESIPPGETLDKYVQRAAGNGLVSGFIVGLVFGLVWAVTIRIGAIYIQLNTLLGQQVFIDEIISFAVIVAVTMAPTYSLYNAFTSAVGHLLLHAIDQRPVRG
jgi:hypothetical protein